MKTWHWDVALFILASPIILIVGMTRAVRRLIRLHIAVQPETPCRTCGDPIVLVGFWRCSCGFTYQGHVLRICPICSSFPSMIRCYRCGATEKVRL